MRLTKIYLKKMRFFSTFGLGLFVGGVAVLYAINSLAPSEVDVLIKPAKQAKSLIPFMNSSSPSNDNKSTDYETLLKSAKIEAVNYLPNSGYLYKFVSGDKHFTSFELISSYSFNPKNSYEIIVTNRKTGAVHSVYR